MTYDASPPPTRRPIGAVRISSVALVGVALAVSVPAVAAAIAMSGRVDEQRQSVTITPTGPISRVVVQDAAGDVIVTGDAAASGADGSADVQWQGKHTPQPVLRQSVENGVLTLRKDCSVSACGSIDIALRVPKDVSVQVTAGDGHVQVQKVTGTVDLTSTNGDLEGDGLGSGDASFHTVNGSVTATFVGAPAKIDVRTTDGDVFVATDGHTAYYDAVQTTTGPMDLQNRPDRNAADEIDVTTVHGSVSVK